MPTATEFRVIKEGETVQVKGSAAKPYIIKNVEGVLSCNCPSWRNAGGDISSRVCKHIIQIIGKEAVEKYLGRKVEDKPVNNKAPKIAPNLLLAELWTPDVDPTGMLMSQKLDGARAFWDGRNFISRNGNIYNAPSWFKVGLPVTVSCDGELYMGVKQFQKTMSIIRSADSGDRWKKVRYMVFDLPSLQAEFEDRIVRARTFLTDAKYAEIVEHSVCKGREHLMSELKKVEKEGGEGLMLRDPRSKYEVGRSRTLLKVKSFIDAEAEVVGYEAGKGKHKGRMGALLCKMANGTEFTLGTGFSDKERENPPAVGSFVTFKYQELTDGGVPRFPSFLRLKTEE